MRQRNWRIVVVGVVLVVMALAFYFFMASIASTSNDPAALMRTVGQAAGGLVGLGVVMIAAGRIGRKSG